MIELSINSIGDIVLALVNTGWIYFHPIIYCILVLTDPNLLSLLALHLEEDGGTFKGSDGAKTPPSEFFEALTCFESFFPSPKTNFPSRIWLNSNY